MPNKSWASRRILIAATFAGFFVSSAALAVTVVVTSTADTVTSCSTTGSGEGGAGCTLRDAITFSNANPETPPASNLIQFDIPGTGVQTIALNVPLPAITTATIVDGYSQPGASLNTLAIGSDAVLLISVQVASLEGFFPQTFMLNISGGTGSVIRGLVMNGASGSVPDPQGGPPFPVDVNPIELDSCCNTIVGNFIGVDPTGNVAGFGGVEARSARNQIGGLAPADRNVLTVVGLGVQVGPGVGQNTVEGNYIGTNAAGNAPLGGVLVIEGSSNTVGPGNVISGGQGVVIIGSNLGGVDNLIFGNFIGTDATGTLPIPNGTGATGPFPMPITAGVTIIEGAGGNIIGTPPGPPILGALYPGNRIAFNNGPGVLVSGLDVPSLANPIRSNSIFANAGLGIDLSQAVNFAPDGVTPNDNCDVDSGGNDLQNFPELTGALVQTGKTAISGTLNSKPNTTFNIQLFANHACDPSGFGEGESLLADLFVTTDSSCNASFQTSVPGELVGQFITATATDPAGNTSEFSECQPVIRITRTLTRIPIRGPVRVAPGVPVEFPFEVRPPNPNTPDSLAGEVIVFDDAGDTCRADVSMTGEGRCSLTFGAPGNYLVRAHYLGNAIFEESTSPPVPALVGMPGGAP